MNTELEIKKLAFALTQHDDDLQLYANGESMDALPEFEQTEDAIMELLYQLYMLFEKENMQMNDSLKKYIEELKDRIADIRENAFYDEEEDLIESNTKVARNESKFLTKFFATLTGTAIAMKPDMISKIISYGVYNGGTVSQIFGKIKETDTNRIFDAMVRSLRTGKTLQEARREVKRELLKTKKYIRNEILSIVNGVKNDVVLSFAFENQTRLLYSTALDGRVCEECNHYEGQIFYFNDTDIPSLPMHINCRCRLIPIPDDKGDYSGLIMPFATYFGMLTPAQQKRRLGKDKYELFEQGEYEIDDYETPLNYQRMTLADLKRRDKGLFA
jgi:SPP1 gp7 family putative phage head morphogenesis protein